VTLLPDQKQDFVIVNQKQLIWQIILQISKKFGLRVSEFVIMTKNGPLSERVYNEQVARYEISSLNIQRKDIKEMNEQNPRRVISQNQDFVKCLISMLIGSDGFNFKNEIINLIESMPVNTILKNDCMMQIRGIKQSGDDTMEAWSRIFFWDKANSHGSVDARTYHVLTLLHDSLILEDSKSFGLFTNE